MMFRFTLSHAVLGSQIISEPDGFLGAKIKLERDPDFFSLIEYYEGAANGAFVFYGRNDTEGINGGIEFIRQVEAAYGFDAELNILVEISYDGEAYSTLFSGQLDLSQKNEMPDNKMQVPVIRDDFWATFINRFETPVNLSDTVDLDGNAVDAVEPISVYMTPQIIRRSYSGYYRYAYDLGQMEDQGYELAQIDFEIEDINELNESKITLPRVLTNTVFPIINAEEAGIYIINIQLTLGHSRTIDANFSYSTLGAYIPFIQKNEDSPTAFVGNDVTHGADVVTEWIFSETVSLNRNDTLKIYIEDQLDFSTERLFIFGVDGFQFSGAFKYGESFMTITAKTTRDPFEAQGYLIHDLIYGVLQRIGLGNTPFYSEFLGGLLTTTRQYDADGCGWMYAILKGLQIRQYTLAEKPFFISMKDIWDGINPILNLGLGYEIVDSEQVIRIEQKSHFIGSTKQVNFSNVRDITASYDQDFIFKTIKTGYSVWQSEDGSGLDDPQTTHTRATPITKSGKDLDLNSGFVAGGLTIEVTARTTKEKTDDYRHDNRNFIISLNTDDLSPDVYLPELDENFNSITGLNDPETRYNSMLTPLRNFLRWGNYLGGCAQNYISSVPFYTFVSGEGNYDMVSDAILGACSRAVLSDTLSESFSIHLGSPGNYNIPLGYFFFPILCTIRIPMEKDEFDLIDRKEPIGISQTDSEFAEFQIKLLEYEIVKGEAVIKAWPKVFFDITVPEQDITTPTCE